MDSHFKKGRLFKTFEEVKTWIAELEKRQGQHYTRFRSKTLEAVKLKRTINPELIYYSLFYKCRYGGSFKSKGKHIRQRNSMKVGCPAFFKMAVSKDGQFLALTEFNEQHNHEDTERTESQTTSAQSHERTTEKADESATERASVTEARPGESVELFEIGTSYEICSEGFDLSFESRFENDQLVNLIAENVQANSGINGGIAVPESVEISLSEIIDVRLLDRPEQTSALENLKILPLAETSGDIPSYKGSMEKHAPEDSPAQNVHLTAGTEKKEIEPEQINASELEINNGYKGLTERQDYVEKKSRASTSVTLCRAPSAEETRGTEKIEIEPEQMNASELEINNRYKGLAERQDYVEKKSQASTSVTLCRAPSAEKTKENHAPHNKIAEIASSVMPLTRASTKSQTSSSVTLYTAPSAEEIKENHAPDNKITEITSIVMPSTRASRGRPKGSVLTAIGLPKKGRTISFAKKTNEEKIRYLLNSLFASDMAKNIAKKEYVVTANDITDDMNSLTDVVADDTVDLKILRPYFERAAFQKLSKITKIKKKADKFSCAVCQKLIVTNCVVCDCCLKWYHYKCVALRKAPRTETWYCPSCSKL